jgi:hypothetical protein
MRATCYAAAIGTSLALVGCGGAERAREASCGIASLAGPTLLLSEFGVPGQTLATPPERLPEQVAVRLVAGPALRGILGRADSLVIVGVEGQIPAAIKPGSGVLVADTSGTARGVLLYEGPPVEGAPIIGTVAIGSDNVPLVGIQLDPAKIEDPRCPFFPDSVIR